MTLLCSIEEILISWSQFKQFDAFRILADHVSWFDTLLLVVILFFLLLSSKASLYKRMQYLAVESICGCILLVHCFIISRSLGVCMVISSVCFLSFA